MGEAMFMDKGSKFIGLAFPCNSEKQFKTLLEHVKVEHRKATHHCYAYVMRWDKQLFRSNDDGEPNGTAGAPILRQIKSHDLTDTLVIVVRYFGGTLLGVSGLINAYRTASSLAIQQCEIITKQIVEKYSLTFDYAVQSIVQSLIKRHSVEIIKSDFLASIQFTCAVRKSKSDEFLTSLQSFPLDKNTVKIKVVYE